MRKLVGAAILLTLLGAGKCESGPANPALKAKVADGTWDAGRQIRRGSWDASKDCTWTITRRDGSKERSGSGRRFYVDSGEVVTTSGCGTLKWHGYDK